MTMNNPAFTLPSPTFKSFFSKLSGIRKLPRFIGSLYFVGRPRFTVLFFIDLLHFDDDFLAFGSNNWKLGQFLKLVFRDLVGDGDGLSLVEALKLVVVGECHWELLC